MAKKSYTDKLPLVNIHPSLRRTAYAGMGVTEEAMMEMEFNQTLHREAVHEIRRRREQRRKA